jgi:hypothetical protein
MPLVGNGFLALWNEHTEEGEDYDFWHTREHVGERLGVPGFRFARRYVGGRGSLPSYFTLYGLDSMDVLESEAYRQLVANPTSWSGQMRPGMRNFLRRGCRCVTRIGAGLGGLIGAGFLNLAATDAEASSALAEMVTQRPFTAMHLGRIDPSVSQLSFAGDEPDIAKGANAVLLVEGYEQRTFETGLELLARQLREVGLSEAVPSFTQYRLAFALTAEERALMPPVVDEEP